MTNREFDLMMRASANREEFIVTEHTENRLRKIIAEGVSAKRVTRFTVRTALIAALIVLLLAATALAVGNLPGVVELIDKMGWGLSEERMEHLLKQTPQPQGQTFELDDISITLGEVIYDGNMLYASAHVSPKEESNVVLFSAYGSPNWYYGIPERGDLPEQEDAKTIIEVAKERGARLVSVDLFMEAPSADGIVGSDFSANPDGSYDFIFEQPSVLTDASGNIPLEISCSQVDITDDEAELSETLNGKTWTVNVPAPAEPLATASPAPTQIPRSAPEGALRVLGYENTNFTKAYKSLYPDGEIVYLGEDADPARTDWDMCYTVTYGDTFDKLMESGAALYDMSGSESLSGWASGMYEPLKRFAYSGEALELIPYEFYVSTYHALFTRSKRFNDIDAWKQAGFSDEDMPETLDGLFDLIDKYAALPKSARKDIRFSDSGTAARHWLTCLVLDMYAADRSGSAFRTDELKALLERADKAAEALKKDNQFGYAVLQENYGSLQGAKNAVPLRLGESDPKRVYTCMSVLAVNGSSPRADAAVSLVEAIVKNMSWECMAKLNANITYEELNAISLEQEIASTMEQVEYFKTKAESEPDKITREEDLAYAQELLDSVSTVKECAEKEGMLAGVCFVYPEDLEAYRSNIAPYLCFDKYGISELVEDSSEFYEARDKYLADKMSTDEFLKRLDEIMK